MSRKWLAVSVAAALAVAGCGASESPTGGGAKTSSGNSGPYGISGGSTSSKGSPGVVVGTEKSKYGTVLDAGPKHLALYMYTPDTPGKSNCTGGCAIAWPPLTAKVTAGPGVDKAKLGQIKRADGSTQVTYAGHPLYYYAQDSSAGQVNGQGVQGIWFALTPKGGKA